MFAEIRRKYLTKPLPLPFVVTTVGESVSQGAIDRPSGYPHHHLLLVVAGEGQFTVEKDSFTLSAGQGVLFREEVPHSYSGTGGVFHTLWVTFWGAESVLDYYHSGRYFRFNAPAKLYDSSRELYEFCSGSSTVLTRSAAGYQWLVDWLHDIFAPSAPLTVQVRLHLEAHFSEDLTLDQIAAAVHMSRYSLCHYYKSTCGMTVMEHLKQIRIAKAKQLLRYGTATVEEIGRSCGFENPSYFSKIFRSETGRSPREYRNQHLDSAR